MFAGKFDIWFCLFSYRSEVVIEDITHSCRICNGSIVKLNWVKNCSCNSFNWNYDFDTFPSIFNVIPVKLMEVIFHVSLLKLVYVLIKTFHKVSLAFSVLITNKAENNHPKKRISFSQKYTKQALYFLKNKFKVAKVVLDWIQSGFMGFHQRWTISVRFWTFDSMFWCNSCLYSTSCAQVSAWVVYGDNWKITFCFIIV